MDYRIIWSPQALEDIEALAGYITRDSLTYAESTVERILEAPERLRQFPKLGRVVPEKYHEDVRNSLFSNIVLSTRFIRLRFMF